MYGQTAKVGLQSGVLPEEDLNRVINGYQDEDFADKENKSEEYLENNLEKVPEDLPLDDVPSEPLLLTDKCTVCTMDCGGAHKCIECHQIVYAICGVSEEKDEGFGSIITCNKCYKRKEVTSIREKAYVALSKQADRMTQNSLKKNPPAQPGDNVTLNIPLVDRSKSQLRNAICIIVSEDEGFYTLGTKQGILPKKYTRGEFDICKESFIFPDEVPDHNIKMRTLAKNLDVGTGQGPVRCDCKKGCTSGRCTCKKNNRQCSSRCHDSQPCNNK